MTNQSEIGIIKRLIQSATNILVITHKRADGDAVGSLVGLGLALKMVGKEVQMVIVDGVPSVYNFLSGVDLVKNKVKSSYDLSIFVDCSDLSRAGDLLPPGETPDINIDHHPTNQYFARINLVKTGAVATSEIIAEYREGMGLPINADIANALLTGLVTDSLGFRVASMNPSVLQIAADLMDAGADLPAIYHQSLTQKTFEATKLWGIGLANLQRENGLVWTSISWSERQSVGYPGKDDADLVNFLPNITGTKIALLILEQPGGRVKISWRSSEGYDVSALALEFGGGGHKPAAGAEITGDYERVIKDVVIATLAMMNLQMETLIPENSP